MSLVTSWNASRIVEELENLRRDFMGQEAEDVRSSTIRTIKTLTKTEFDALATKAANTLYLVGNELHHGATRIIGQTTEGGSADPRIFPAVKYGMIPGVDDASIAIRAAADAAALAGGGVVLLPRGKYNIRNTVDFKDKVSVEGYGCTLNVVGAPDPLFRWDNRPPLFTGGVRLTAAANAAERIGVSALYLTSTAGLKQGDYVLLGCDTEMKTLSTGRYEGEWVRIRSVESTTKVTLWGPLANSYPLGSNPRIWIYRLWTGTGVRGVSFIQEDRYRDLARTEMITMIGTMGMNVRDVDIRDGGGPGMGLHYCVDFTVHAMSIANLRDWEPDGSSRWYGYGMHLSAGVQNGTITGCNFRQMRHAITTGGYTGHAGEPRGIVVSGCVATECTLTAFDTHAEGDNISFIGNHVYNTNHAAFTLRCKRTRVIGNTVDGADRGVWMPEQRLTEVIVEGNSFNNLAGHGVDVGWWGVGLIRITGNTFSMVGRHGIKIPRGVVQVVISRNSFVNCGRVAGSNGSGIFLEPGAEIATVPSTLYTTDIYVMHNEFIQEGGFTGMVFGIWVHSTSSGVNKIVVAGNIASGLRTDWVNVGSATAPVLQGNLTA